MNIGIATDPQSFREASDELAAWASRLPRTAGGMPRFPAPDEGLPPGWVSQSHLFNHQVRSFLWLARRDGGGWVVVSHDRENEQTRVISAGQTLADLYRGAAQASATGTGFAPGNARLAGWLRNVLLSMYDPQDPVEKAEQVLFALSGDLTVVPRAAL